MSAERDQAVANVDSRAGHTVEFCHSPEAHRAAYDAEEVTLISVSDPQMRVLHELAEAEQKQPRQWNANRWQPLRYTLSRPEESALLVTHLERLGLIETNDALHESYDDWRETRGTGARLTDQGWEFLGIEEPLDQPPKKLTRKEFIKQFRVPADTTQAFKFGRSSAYHGHKQFSFQEFFRNDVEVRVNQVGRDSLYKAYKRGHQVGKQMRRLREERETGAAG